MSETRRPLSVTLTKICCYGDYSITLSASAHADVDVGADPCLGARKMLRELADYVGWSEAASPLPETPQESPRG
jgi:hypothetical protein